MESNSWSRFAHHSAFHSLHAEPPRDANHLGWRDLSLECEEADGCEEESRPEFACPFCSEDFDVVGLCCHIDEEHPVEAKNGVCSICASSVGPDLVAHIITQHGNFFKTQRRRRCRKEGQAATQSMLSLLKKDFHEGNIQALVGGSSFMAPTTAEHDPFLSSLIYILPTDESSKDSQPESLGEIAQVGKSPDEKVVERSELVLSDEDQKELTLRSDFVQGLVLSTVFDDPL